MPEILPTILALGSGVRRITWAGLAGGDTGAWVNVANAKQLIVTVEGTVTTFAFQGSNEAASANPRTLEDEDNTALTAAGIYKVKELPLTIRPNLTTGSGVTVSALVKA